ncbi:hypothetical protein H4R99_002353 [Coemansia sp. RSA 1722]|nr:hypothetical protein IWW45_002406 [Coemansia sp. RSA 485]KAJ2603495.1 hypothetical protein H4R99_002353 [Coemansia sp. RSA 1722]
MPPRSNKTSYLAESQARQMARNHAFDGHTSYIHGSSSEPSMSSHMPKITLQRVLYIAFWTTIQAIIVAYKTVDGKNSGDTMKGFNAGVEILIMFNISFILLLMSPILMSILRKTPLSRVVVIEKNAHAHKVVGYTLIVAVIIHAVAHYYKFHQLEVMSKGKMTFMMLAFHKQTGIIGHAMLFSLTFMMAAAMPIVRRKMFEVFYLLHHLSFVIIILIFFHIPGTTFKYYIAGPGAIYVIDRLYRFVRSRTNRPEILSVIEHPSNVIELRFAKKDMDYQVGQYIYINIPSISWFQWHPFTLTSAPEDDELSIHIYVAGGWTGKLVRSFKQRAVHMPKRMEIVHHSVPAPARAARRDFGSPQPHRPSSGPVNLLRSDSDMSDFTRGGISNSSTQRSQDFLPPEMDYYSSSKTVNNTHFIKNHNKALPAAPAGYDSLPTIMIDGPYGAPTQHVFDFENVVLISSGIGVTPMSSVLKSIYYQLSKAPHKRKFKKVYFIWVCRDIKSLEWFRDLLAALDAEDIGHIIEIRTYLTGQLSVDHIRNISMNQDRYGPDAVTGLYRSPTYYGRPNFDKIFEDIGRRNPDTDIGVFFCGSKQLGRKIRNVKRKWNNELKHRNTSFVYHEEKST